MYFANFLLACLLVLPLNLFADALVKFNELKNAGIIVQTHDGDTLLSTREDQYFIPASTTKLVTAWLALQHWGEEKRFATDFYYDDQTYTLSIKGSGDPYLVSEELKLIAEILHKQGLTRVNKVILDTSDFATNLTLPGTGKSHNPYDAIPTALAANFNTIHVKRIGHVIQSAEKQTPLTPFAKTRAHSHDGDKFRINTGLNPRDAERYFAELLLAFLKEEGVQVKTDIHFAAITKTNVFYRHHNSKTLAQIIRPMMKYSTNFIANQLILMLSSEHYSRPANRADVKAYLQITLKKAFKWQNFTLEEGAGLSRNNRLSPLQLTDLLKRFTPWQHLLPEIEDKIFAKSGTLENVSTLAGYIVLDGEWQPFAVMMNQAVPSKLRSEIARHLREHF